MGYITRTAVLATFVLGCLAGCETARPIRAIVTQSIDQLVGPGMNLPFAGGTQATVKGDADRLAVDLRRSIEREHWGLANFGEGPLTATGHAPEFSDRSPTTSRESGKADHLRVFHAKALLPDDRAAIIVAWSEGQKITVAIRVGHFGDSDMQERFCARLEDTLADKPRPKRGGKYVLPKFE